MNEKLLICSSYFCAVPKMRDLNYCLKTTINQPGVLANSEVVFFWKEVFKAQEGTEQKVKWKKETGTLKSIENGAVYGTEMHALNHPTDPGTITVSLNLTGINAPNTLGAINPGEESIIKYNETNANGLEQEKQTVQRAKSIVFQVDLSAQKSHPKLCSSGSGTVVLWEQLKNGTWQSHQLPFAIPAEQAAGSASDPGHYVLQGTHAGPVALTIECDSGVLTAPSSIAVISADLDIDSDNSGEVNSSNDEEKIETDTTKPGKIIIVNPNAQVDTSGVPLSADDLTMLKLKAGNLTSVDTISLNYSPGLMRIWKTGPDQLPSAADYIEPGHSYTLSELGITSGGMKNLSIQAIANIGGLSTISVQVTHESFSVDDAVLVSLGMAQLNFIKPGTEMDALPQEITDDKKNSEGEVVGINWDDDNNSEGNGGHGKIDFKNDFDDVNGTAGENDMIQIKLRKPAIEGTKARLKYDNTFIKIWQKADRKDEVKSEDTEIDLTEDKIVYIEGKKLTEAETPTIVEMRIKVGATADYTAGDRVSVHVATPIITFYGKHQWTGGAASRNLADQLRNKQYLGARRRDDRNNTVIIKGKNSAGKVLWYSVDMFDLVPYSVGNPDTDRPLVMVRAPALDKEMKMALGLQGAHVFFDGHSNYGLGPNFNPVPTSLDDYMNISGRNITTIDYEELTGAHGDTSVTLRDIDYVAQATNSVITGVGQLKFSGPPDGANLTRMDGNPVPGHPYHYTRHSSRQPSVTNYEVIVNSNGDLPMLRYQSCFMASCNTGRHFYETLNQGKLLYTMNLTIGTIGLEGEIEGDLMTLPGPPTPSTPSGELGASWGITHYVRLLTEGKSWDEITEYFNAQQTVDPGNSKIEGLYDQN